MMPASATAKRIAARMPKKALADRERGMASPRSFEPLVEQDDGRSAVHQSARNPHDEPRKPLIVDWVEADAGHPHSRVIGIPRAGREAHQSSQRAANQ